MPASAELVEEWICEPGMGSNAITARVLQSFVLNLLRAAPLLVLLLPSAPPEHPPLPR